MELAGAGCGGCKEREKHTHHTRSSSSMFPVFSLFGVISPSHRTPISSSLRMAFMEEYRVKKSR